MLHTKQVVIANLDEASSAQYVVPIIGYYDQQYLYLLWSVTYDQVMKYMKSIGSSFTYNKRATQKAIQEEFQIKDTKVIRTGNTTKRVVPIPIKRIQELELSFAIASNQPPPPDF